MKARDLIGSEQVWGVSAEDDLRKVAQLMTQHNIGAMPVMDREGRLEGIITDRDIVVRALALGKDQSTKVGEIMSKPVQTIHADADIREVESAMERFRIRRLPVMDQSGRICGFISLGDLAKHYHGLLRQRRVAEVLETVSTDAR